jgi:hypothetical protein
VTPSPPVIPHTTGAPRDLWGTWFGDATQVEPEWAIPAPDRRLIQPVTHYDTGNRPLNYILNKIVFPWRNLLGSAENIVLPPFLGLRDLLEEAKFSAYGPFVQAAEDMLPLEGAMGLTGEIGPALDWAQAWASTSSRTLAIGRFSPTWWLMGASGGVGGGGSLGSLQTLEPELPAAEAGLSATPPAINPRLVDRLAAWQRYEGPFGPRDWVKRTQGAPWGTGFSTGYGRLGRLSRPVSQVQINNQFGRAFQQSVQGAVLQPENFTLLEGGPNGIWTRPDILTDFVVGEVKAYQTSVLELTPQIEAQISVATSSGRAYVLITLPETEVAPELIDAIKSSDSLLVHFDPATGAFTPAW